MRIVVRFWRWQVTAHCLQWPMFRLVQPSCSDFEKVPALLWYRECKVGSKSPWKSCDFGDALKCEWSLSWRYILIYLEFTYKKKRKNYSITALGVPAWPAMRSDAAIHCPPENTSCLAVTPICSLQYLEPATPQIRWSNVTARLLDPGQRLKQPRSETMQLVLL